MMNNKKRLSPIYIIINFIKSYKLFIPILLVIGKDIEWKYAIILGIICLNIILQIANYYTTYYEIKDTSIVSCTGIFSKSEKHIDFSNIQNVDTTQDFFAQLFNLVSVDINIMSETIKLDPVTRTSANEIITAINRDIYQEKNVSENINGGKMSLGIKDLVVLSFLNSRMFATFFAILAFYDEVADLIQGIFGVKLGSYLDDYRADLFQDLKSTIYFLSICFGLLFIISFIVSFVKYYNFVLESKDDKLLLKYGLLSKKSLVIKKERIQNVEISRNWRYGIFGFSKLKVTSLSGSVLEDLKSLDGIEVIPIAKKQFVEEFVNNILNIDTAKYENNEYEKIPDKAKPIMIRWSIFNNSLLVVILTSLIYFIPVFKKNVTLSISIATLIVIFSVIISIISYKYKTKNTAISLANGMIVNKSTMFLTRYVTYIKPQKVGNIIVNRNVFLNSRNLCHIVVNSLGAGGDIALRYFDVNFAKKIETYLLNQEE